MKSKRMWWYGTIVAAGTASLVLLVTPVKPLEPFSMGAGSFYTIPTTRSAAPDFDLPQIRIDRKFWEGRQDTARVTLAQFRGRPVILNFWSPTCPPCVAEHEDLVRAAKKNKDVQFIGIVPWTDEDDGVRAFFKDRARSPYPTLKSPDKTLTTAYKTHGIPTTVFIDSNGKITRAVAGQLDSDTISKWIRQDFGGK